MSEDTNANYDEPIFTSNELEVEEASVEEVEINLEESDVEWAESVVSTDEDPAEDAVISSKPVSQGSKKSGVTILDNGAFGSAKAEKINNAPKRPTPEDTVEKVALFSTKNVSWLGIGKLNIGYNIVTKQQSEQWLTRGHVRLATPEEVAQEFNK